MRKIHRYIGLVMLLPMFGWSITGLVFFIKPGYEGAYEILKLKTYPLDTETTLPGDAEWLDARLVKSVLGHHLLVNSYGVALHLHPKTLEEQPIPDAEQLVRLFDDTIAHNIERYGTIERIQQTTAYTSTGIKIVLDWPTLTFTQTGLDQKLIDTLYKVHYLQWTPWQGMNQVLGIFGLFLVAALSALGMKIYLGGRRK